MEPQLNPEVIHTTHAHDGPIETDAVIVGAGPVGLFQVFELGLLEIKAHVIDSLGYPGGQPIELYPDKPIYDIPALPVCGAQELVDRLMKQVEPMHPVFHFGEEVTALERRDDGRFLLRTSAETAFLAKTVVIAAGLGSFQPRASFHIASNARLRSGSSWRSASSAIARCSGYTHAVASSGTSRTAIRAPAARRAPRIIPIPSQGTGRQAMRPASSRRCKQDSIQFARRENDRMSLRFAPAKWQKLVLNGTS